MINKPIKINTNMSIADFYKTYYKPVKPLKVIKYNGNNGNVTYKYNGKTGIITKTIIASKEVLK